MSEFDKKMEEVFDITPVEVTEPKKKTLLPAETDTKNTEALDQDLDDAYQQSKENLQTLIDQGQEAMQEILEIAKAGQHPRAFEVYGGLLKNMVDANKELLSIQKQMREMSGVKKETASTQIDKAIFVGSTSELSKLLKNNGNKKE